MHRTTSSAATLTLDLQPSLKSFALGDIIALTSGYALTTPARLNELIAYVTETQPEQAAAHAKDAKACVEAQLPFLRDIDYALLHASFSHDPDFTALWIKAQVRRYGDGNWVMPLSLWQKRKNSHKL